VPEQKQNVSQAEAMTIEANKTVLRRYKVDILNSRDVDALDEVVAEDYLDHAAFPGQAAGLDGLKQRVATMFRALDPHWTIHDVIADDVMDGPTLEPHRDARRGIPGDPAYGQIVHFPRHRHAPCQGWKDV